MHDPEPIRAAKEAATDALVARTRAATPPGVAEMRRQPRLSVAEMNNQDWDTLRERFLATRRDDRPSWVRVLDAIDAPRNQILSHLAPGLERKARESGETAAFGTGRVNFSDVLGEAGLKPGVIRAILGFVGDLAFDPLTYIGAPAVGLKVANKAGQGVGIGVRGTRELTGGLFREGAIKAVKRGGLGAVKAGKTRDLLEAAARTAAPGLDNAGLASHLSSRVLGAPTQGRLGRAFSRVGGALEHEGGILANYGEFGLAGQLDDEARAARAFVAEYGAGAGPGIRLGKNATRAIAHIPFTDIGLHVPAFTDKAKYAADSLKVANQTGTVDPYAARGPGVTAAAATVQKVRDIEDAIKTGKMPVRSWRPREAVDEATNALYTALDPIHATTDDLLSELDQHRIDLERIINGGNKPQGIDAATPKDIGELLSLKQLIRQADAAAESAKARAAAFSDPNHPGAVAARSVEDAERNLRDSIRGAATNWASHDPEKVRFVQRLVGADDPVTGSSLLGSVASAASKWRDGGVAAEIAHRADQSIKATFGQPGGMLRSMWRYLQNTMSTGRRERYISLERELRGQVLDAMEAAGLDRTVDDYQKAADIVTAHMAVARNEAARVAAEQAGQLVGAVPGTAPNDLRFFLTDNNGKPLKWVENLVNAQKSGYFSKAHGSGLHDALRDIAAKNNDLLDSLGDAEFADEILGARLLDYLPNSTTTGARARISAQKQYAVKRGASRGKAGKLASESFQKARTSRQYRFVDGAGKKQQFFDFDRWATTFDEKELEQLAKEDPDTADHVRELGQAIREYDARAKADPQWAADNAPRNTHPAEMNQLAREGRFSLLLGGDPVPGGDFMDTNVASMMAARAMAHESSVAQRDWLDFVDGGMRVAVDPKKFQGHRMGDNLVLKDGTVAKTFRDPRSQKPGIEILGQRYRPLSDSFGAKDNPIVQGIGNTKAYLYHEDLARLLEESAKVYDQQGAELLKFLDAATAAWKTQSLMHPSWTIANLVGDSINYLTGGVRIADLAKNAAPLAKVFANLDDPNALRGIELNIRGVPVTGEKFVNDLRAQRLIGNNAAAETVLQMNNRGIFYMPSHVRKGKKGWAGVKQALNPKTIASDISTLKGSFLQGAAHQSAAARLAAGAKASGLVARERLVNGLISPWFRSNEVMQDYMRAMAYASHLEQGHDIPMAVRKTIDSGFDYSDLTRVERNVFRRLFPFYSWMKNNGAYQLKQLMDRPIYTGMYPLLLNAAEEAINGDQQIPLHARPGWMRNQLALMVGKDPNRQALMLGSGLPVEQALVALEPLLGGPEGVQDFLKYFTTSTNTLLRAPAEIGVGREFFTDRTIGPQGDIGAGEYVANQFRPYREFNKVGETFEKHGAVPAAARVLLGGRLQGADDERLRVSKLREFKAEEERIRRQIATAGYRNDAKASVRARANQLALYRDMITAGFESDTPVWAREQLSQLAAGPGA